VPGVLAFAKISAARTEDVARALSSSWGHVARCEKNLSRQLELERDGHDTVMAKALLVQFEELQAVHIADRDRLRREVGE